MFDLCVYSAHWGKTKKSSLDRALQAENGLWWPTSKRGVPRQNVGNLVSQEPPKSFSLSAVSSASNQQRQAKLMEEERATFQAKIDKAKNDGHKSQYFQ